MMANYTYWTGDQIFVQQTVIKRRATFDSSWRNKSALALETH